jgi:hypothetical protein
MVSNLPLNTQTRAHLDFAAQLKTDPRGMVDLFLKEFNNCLFTRLAYQLCPAYNQSPQTRAYFRSLIHHTATELINLSWQTIIKSKPARPAVLIVGGGHGSGKLTCSFNPAISLQREISLIYDGSTKQVNELGQLLKEAHTYNVHTLVTFIQRPLRDAALAAIRQSTEKGEIPDPDEFVDSHMIARDNFLTLVAHYKKRKEQFTPLIIFNEKAGQPYTTSHRDLKQIQINKEQALITFREAWDELQKEPNITSRSLGPINKARRSKNPTTSAVLLIAHYLSQTLRRNINGNVQPFKRIESTLLTAPPQAQEPSHHHLTVQQEVIESSDDWRSQTAEGLQRTLDRQHPSHVVVREKKTHEHEMETVLER